jgi:hypothetical protein
MLYRLQALVGQSIAFNEALEPSGAVLTLGPIVEWMLFRRQNEPKSRRTRYLDARLA